MSIKKEVEDLENEFSETASDLVADGSISPKIRQQIYELWLRECSTRMMSKIFYHEHIFLRVFWIIFAIITGTISLYVTVKYLKTYYSYSTIVNIDYIYESPTAFPSITICNLNPFYKSRSDAYIHSILERNNLTNIKRDLIFNQSQSAMNLTTTILEVIRANIASNETMSLKERKSLGFDINEMLVSCSFNGLSCLSINFTWFPSYEYGNCYIFNGGTDANHRRTSIQRISTAGHQNGLELELFVGSSNNEDWIYESGVHVVVHNQSFEPILDSEGIHAASGFQTNIGIRRTFLEKLGNPYSNCKEYLSPNFNSRLVRAIFKKLNHTEYRQSFCYKLCYQEKVIQDCNCSDPSLPYNFDENERNQNVTHISIKPCFNKTEVQCLIKSKGQFRNNPIGKECSDECPLECNQIFYDYVTSMSKYPTDTYLKRLLNQDIFDYNENNANKSTRLLKLNIFYQEMFYQIIKETPALTWDTLIGNIGGILSLFIGVNVLTLGDLIELAFLKLRKIFLF